MYFDFVNSIFLVQVYDLKGFMLNSKQYTYIFRKFVPQLFDDNLF